MGIVESEVGRRVQLHPVAHRAVTATLCDAYCAGITRESAWNFL
jgi:hypothetical protein